MAGGDVMRAIEFPQLVQVKDSNLFFLQFNVSIPDKGNIKRTLGNEISGLFGILNRRPGI